MQFQIVVDALTRIITDIVNFIPNLINGIIIFLVGYLVATLVRWIIRTVLVQIRFDPLVERVGITASLRGVGLRTPLSTIVAQTLFLLLLLSFMITATRLMGLEAVSQLLEGLLRFLPNIIAAIIIFLLGGIVAQFVGNLLTALAVGAGLQYGARLGRLVQYLISVFVIVLALSQLGIDTSILVTALTIVIAAFGLALGLSLGLGSREIVRHVLSGYYLRQRLVVGQRVTVNNTSGVVQSVGSVNTVITQDAGAVVVPNTHLLESTVALNRAEGQ